MQADDSFILGSTGDILQGLGAIESDIYMQSEKILTILREHPEITPEEIKRIPQIVEDPILILKSKGVGRGKRANTRLVIFGGVKAKNGQPVLSVLDLRPVENNLVIDDMQKITSAYTKTTNPTDFISKSDILYADKNRTAKLLRTIGFQMPIELQLSGYIGSISYIGQKVNINGTPFSKVVRMEEMRNDYLSDEEFQKRYGQKLPTLDGDADSGRKQKFSVDDTNKNYMDAVNRGDLAEAQRMVDQAAENAGYVNVFYHGAKKGGGFTEFRDWSYFTENRKYADF